MNKFVDGFEKKAGIRVNLAPPAQVKLPTFSDKIRGFLNKQKPRTYAGMGILGVGGVLGGGYKLIDSSIGTSAPENEW